MWREGRWQRNIVECVAGGGCAGPDTGTLAWPFGASASMCQGQGSTSQEAGQQGEIKSS